MSEKKTTTAKTMLSSNHARKMCLWNVATEIFILRFWFYDVYSIGIAPSESETMLENDS